MNTWRTIPEEYGYYEVSENGLARNSKTGKIRKLLHKPDGYVSLPAKKNGVQRNPYMHILVAQAFIHNPENKTEVHHIDGDRSNNTVENLMWVTPEEHVLLHRGKRQKTNKAKSIPVAQYTLDLPCELIKVWPSLCEIQRELGYLTGNIAKCCKGKYKSAYGYQWSYWEE